MTFDFNSQIGSGSWVKVNTTQPSRDFVSVPNEILFDRRLSFEARLLYMLLLSYNWQPGKLLPNIDTLMNDMHCDTEALIMFLYELKAHGLLDTYPGVACLDTCRIFNLLVS